MSTPRPPLGLPTGSVRAIIALSLVGSVIALAFRGQLDPREVLTLATAAVAFYFGGRAPVPASSSAPAKPSDWTLGQPVGK